MRTTLLIAALLFSAGLRSAARASDGVWMVTGGVGPSGDCMMEWALRWDAAWEPGVCALQPLEADGEGNEGRLDTKQYCVEGTGCDQDGQTDGICTFKVAMCFCVNDPATKDCPGIPGGTRATWCSSWRTASKGPFWSYAYKLEEPVRTSTDDDDQKARCLLEKAMRGCVKSFDPGAQCAVPSKYAKYQTQLQRNDDCGDVCSATPAPAPLVAKVGDDPVTVDPPDVIETMCPDPASQVPSPDGCKCNISETCACPPKPFKDSPAKKVTPTAFLMTTSKDTSITDHPWRSLLHHARYDGQSWRFGTDPDRCYDDGNPETKSILEQFVHEDDWSTVSNACTDFQELTVNLRPDGQDLPEKTLTLHGRFWQGRNKGVPTDKVGHIDRGGGDHLELTCLRAGSTIPNLPPTCANSNAPCP